MAAALRGRWAQRWQAVARSSGMMRLAFAALALALLPLATARAQADAQATAPAAALSHAEIRASLPPGRTLPDFALPTLDGVTYRLSEQIGRVVVLNMWATWCGPCRAEMPDLDRLSRDLGPLGLSVVGISIDESLDVVRPFAERIGVSYPLALDDGRMVERLGASGVMPITYVLDRQGRLRVIAEGLVTYDDLSATLRALLDDAP